MKYKRHIFSGFMVLIVCCMAVQFGGHKLKTKDPVPGSCTIFSVSVGEKVFFGNNEDFYRSDTYVWTDPATEENYGCVYLGFKEYAHQGGINEKGLCFDANALPKSRILLHPELEPPPYYDSPYDEFMVWAPVLMLRKAATVQEAIDIARRYQRDNWYPNSETISYQLNFADATGDAVVMSVDQKGELVFSRKKPGDHYLISTNFNKANPLNALEYPCRRYEIAQGMLENIEGEEDLNAAYVKTILDSVHQKGIFTPTLYSNIFDLKKGRIFLYHWHQFGEVVELEMEKELAKGSSLVRIKDLFSEQTVTNASSAYIGSIVWLCLSILLGVGAMIAAIHFLKKYVQRKRAAKKK